MILYVNACVRNESRTRRLAEKLIDKLESVNKEEIKEVRLENISMPIADEEFIIKRDILARSGRFDDPMFDLARDFASADTIVIAAPYWDLSFPAMLKQYIEQINVVGLTFKYLDNGMPMGLCKAGRLYYVTTAGGPIVSDEYGFGYVRTIAEVFYGIKDIHYIKAEGLDIVGADVEAILKAVPVTI